MPHWRCGGSRCRRTTSGATAEGDNELEDGLPVLERIRIQSRLRIPRGQRETAERALAKQQAKCPTAAWMKDAVEITWEAEIEEK